MLQALGFRVGGFRLYVIRYRLYVKIIGHIGQRIQVIGCRLQGLQGYRLQIIGQRPQAIVIQVIGYRLQVKGCRLQVLGLQVFYVIRWAMMMIRALLRIRIRHGMSAAASCTFQSRLPRRGRGGGGGKLRSWGGALRACPLLRSQLPLPTSQAPLPGLQLGSPQLAWLLPPPR